MLNTWSPIYSAEVLRLIFVEVPEAAAPAAAPPALARQSTAPSTSAAAAQRRPVPAAGTKRRISQQATAGDKRARPEPVQPPATGIPQRIDLDPGAFDLAPLAPEPVRSDDVIAPLETSGIDLEIEASPR